MLVCVLVLSRLRAYCGCVCACAAAYAKDTNYINTLGMAHVCICLHEHVEQGCVCLRGPLALLKHGEKRVHGLSVWVYGVCVYASMVQTTKYINTHVMAHV
jgi:hypothetical protein